MAESKREMSRNECGIGFARPAWLCYAFWLLLLLLLLLLLSAVVNVLEIHFFVGWAAAS